MKTNKIEQDITIYDANNIYEFDNSIMMHYYPKRILEIRKEEKIDKEGKCLELGIGHGYSTEIFSGSFEQYTVLDGDKEIIERFKRKHPDLEINIIQTYFEDYSTNEQYDVILMGFVLEHVDEPQVILERYKKLLSEKGRIFITVPNAEALNRRIGEKAGILKDMNMLSEHDIRCGHKRYYTTKTLEEEINNAGLNVIRREGIFLKAITTAQMISLKFSDNIIRGLLEVGKTYPELSLGLLYEVEK